MPGRTAKRYLYVVFALENLTQRPVMNPATNFPKTDENGKVVYKYVPITTLKVVPDETYLQVETIREKLVATVDLFLEVDEEDTEIAKRGLWPKRIHAADVRLEQKMTPQERVRYHSRLPYLSEFLRKTADYDLVKGNNELPASIDAKARIRGVAFFADLPMDIDKYSLYFAGISNHHKVSS